MHLRASPAAHVDASCALLARRRIDLRRKARERPHVVDEQAHRDGVLAGELACKTPGDTDVAVIVDDAAEDVPARGGCGHRVATCRSRIRLGSLAPNAPPRQPNRGTA